MGYKEKQFITEEIIEYKNTYRRKTWDIRINFSIKLTLHSIKNFYISQQKLNKINKNYYIENINKKNRISKYYIHKFRIRIENIRIKIEMLKLDGKRMGI